MAFLSEADIESALLSYFADLGYAVESEENIGPDGKRPERESFDTVILRGRLEKAIGRLNPELPAEARADAIRTLTQCELPNLLEENRRIHKLLVEGVDVEYFGEDGVLTSGKVRILDFDDPDANDWMVDNQFTVVAGRINRRPDVVVFVNGLPLAVVELKAPGDENATLSAAFNQLQTYKQQIPALFHT
ncbi:type I restriction endonuclease, partial [uncultured Bilophila sp.]